MTNRHRAAMAKAEKALTSLLFLQNASYGA